MYCELDLDIYNFAFGHVKVLKSHSQKEASEKNYIRIIVYEPFLID